MTELSEKQVERTEEELTSDNTGVVDWFSKERGIGFIRRDNDEKDLFCHYSNIIMDGFKFLVAGQVVKFKIGANHVGPQAEEVVVLREPEENDEY